MPTNNLFLPVIKLGVGEQVKPKMKLEPLLPLSSRMYNFRTVRKTKTVYNKANSYAAKNSTNSKLMKIKNKEIFKVN